MMEVASPSDAGVASPPDAGEVFTPDVESGLSR
jgi:hypothetical protein